MVTFKQTILQENEIKKGQKRHDTVFEHYLVAVRNNRVKNHQSETFSQKVIKTMNNIMNRRKNKL